jgi:hypothetical protein
MVKTKRSPLLTSPTFNKPSTQRRSHEIEKAKEAHGVRNRTLISQARISRRKLEDTKRSEAKQHYKYIHLSTMVQEMSYSTLAAVIDSWETIKRGQNFEEKIGVALFEK